MLCLCIDVTVSMHRFVVLVHSVVSCGALYCCYGLLVVKFFFFLTSGHEC